MGAGAGIAHIRTGDSSTLFVYLSSHQSDWHDNDYPFRFSFMRTARASGRSALMLRDRSNLWYQQGIEGAPSIEAVVSLIQSEGRDYDRTVLIGASMGGYAALLLGCLADVDAVVAIAPQIRIGASAREIGDDRFQAEFATLETLRPQHPLYRLENSLPGPGRTGYVIAIGKDDWIDVQHMLALPETDRIRRYAFEDVLHAELARFLINNGNLDDLVDVALAARSP